MVRVLVTKDVSKSRDLGSNPGCDDKSIPPKNVSRSADGDRDKHLTWPRHPCEVLHDSTKKSHTLLAAKGCCSPEPEIGVSVSILPARAPLHIEFLLDLLVTDVSPFSFHFVHVHYPESASHRRRKCVCWLVAANPKRSCHEPFAATILQVPNVRAFGWSPDVRSPRCQDAFHHVLTWTVPVARRPYT